MIIRIFKKKREVKTEIELTSTTQAQQFIKECVKRSLRSPDFAEAKESDYIMTPDN